MTGIPSIVAGLFAYALFVIIFGPGTKSGLAGAVALSVVALRLAAAGGDSAGAVPLLLVLGLLPWAQGVLIGACYRAQEYEADALATARVGIPVAQRTLFRLAQYNGTPLRRRLIAGLRASHPATAQRIERVAPVPAAT